ncbi:hypothetical protein Tco_0414102 [Tanacetum coccineum]
MQVARDRKKSYADLKSKPMEFQVGDKVMLKVSPWKGIVHFGKRGKLNPRYVGPFKVLEKVGSVAYKFELPQELSRVHNTFHVSNLKKCYVDEPLAVLLDGLHFDDKLYTSSTNDTNTASPQVSTASLNVNAASPQVNTASVSDNTVYAFMVENPNGFNVLHQDLEQIYEDDWEAMDLKWQLPLLSVRAKKAPRSKEGQFRNQDNTRKQGNNEDKSSKAMLAIDGVDSEVYTDKTCSKTCLKNYETLKKQCDDLLVKLNESEFKAITYKRGLATLEDQIITYKKNEVLFSEEIRVLKREVACKDYEINMLKSEFEKVKQEKEGIEFKIEKFDKASKDLDQLLGSQITDKCKKGLGYSAVPPPHPLIYNRPNKLDLSYSGLDEFKEPEFKGYGPKDNGPKDSGPKDSKQESNVVCDKKSDNSKENSEESLVEEQVSQDTSSFVESSPNVDKETVFPVNKKVELTKPKNHEKPVKKSVRLIVITIKEEA